jgi:maltooligosyltrehalose synthase
MRPELAVVPRATYRVQLHRGFRLADVESLLDDLTRLPVTLLESAA